MIEINADLKQSISKVAEQIEPSHTSLTTSPKHEIDRSSKFNESPKNTKVENDKMNEYNLAAQKRSEVPSRQSEASFVIRKSIPTTGLRNQQQPPVDRQSQTQGNGQEEAFDT